VLALHHHYHHVCISSVPITNMDIGALPYLYKHKNKIPDQQGCSEKVCYQLFSHDTQIFQQCIPCRWSGACALFTAMPAYSWLTMLSGGRNVYGWHERTGLDNFSHNTHWIHPIENRVHDAAQFELDMPGSQCNWGRHGVTSSRLLRLKSNELLSSGHIVVIQLLGAD